MYGATKAKAEAIYQAQLKAAKVLTDLARLAQEAAVEQTAFAAALEEAARVQQEQAAALAELPWS